MTTIGGGGMSQAELDRTIARSKLEEDAKQEVVELDMKRARVNKQADKVEDLAVEPGEGQGHKALLAVPPALGGIPDGAEPPPLADTDE